MRDYLFISNILNSLSSNRKSVGAYVIAKEIKSLSILPIKLIPRGLGINSLEFFTIYYFKFQYLAGIKRVSCLIKKSRDKLLLVPA